MRSRLPHVAFALTLLAGTAGCGGSSSPRPIAAGTVERGTAWKKPVQRAGEAGENHGNPIPAGSRVEVYDQFILVTPPGEPTFLSPHGW